MSHEERAAAWEQAWRQATQLALQSADATAAALEAQVKWRDPTPRNWQRCPTPRCPGDGRYAAPGRGHDAACRFPTVAETGWFACIDEEEEGLWQAVLQVPGACHALEGIWFHSQADAEDFIRQQILGQGMLE